MVRTQFRDSIVLSSLSLPPGLRRSCFRPRWWTRPRHSACPCTSLTYIYDDVGRLIGSVDPAGETVTYTYDAAGNLLAISRYSSSQVSIIDFTPDSGPVGTSVTIFGTGFSATPSQNTVTFNGVAATVSSATVTQLVTSVPAGATTGPISVSTPSGSATSSTPFTVTTSGLPTITGFTPTIGTPGTAVTISGTNFEPTLTNNKVMFNNVSYAPVTSATATTIATSVPSGMGSGRISVATPAGKAVSTADFFIPPSPFTAADVQVTGRIAIGGSGTTVTITTANKIGLIVFDGSAGQRVTLTISSVTIALSTVAIHTPTATSLTSLPVSTGGYVIKTTLPVSGTYTVLVDPYSTYTGSMTLTLASPDLTPTALTAPASATTQQAISVSWTVTNQGLGAANPPWFDYVYLSTDTACCTGDTNVANVAISTALAAGGSYTQTKPITVPNVSAGNYYLILKVDGTGGVYEADETNNQRVVSITISQ